MNAFFYSVPNTGLHCLFGGFNCVWIWCVHCRYRPFIISLVFLFIAWARHGSAQIEARCGKTASQNKTLQNGNSSSSINQKHLHRLSLSLHSISNIHVLKYQSKQRYTQTISKWHHIPALLCVFLFLFPSGSWRRSWISPLVRSFSLAQLNNGNNLW